VRFIKIILVHSTNRQMEREENLREIEDKDNLETLEEQSSSVVVCDQNLVETVDPPVKKTNIVENQWETLSKRTGCCWQVRASCPKTMGVLSISSLSLSHNDHPIRDKTNRFAVKYRTFTDNMLNDIKFWTETSNITMRTQYQMLIKQYPNTFFLPQDISNAIQTFKRQNHVECEAAILLNYLLERKAEDTR
ncbi:10978_t:CDS:2, partial [Gigaspora rosea]